jgi:hypothetical protein
MGCLEAAFDALMADVTDLSTVGQSLHRCAARLDHLEEARRYYLEQCGA